MGPHWIYGILWIYQLVQVFFSPTLLLNICFWLLLLYVDIVGISTSSQHLGAWLRPSFIHDDASIVTKVDGILNSPTDAVCGSDTCSIDLGDPCILQGCILGWSSNWRFQAQNIDVTRVTHHQAYQAVSAADLFRPCFLRRFFPCHSNGQGSKALL